MARLPVLVPPGLFDGGEAGFGAFRNKETRDRVKNWFDNRARNEEREDFVRVFGTTLGLTERATAKLKAQEQEELSVRKAKEAKALPQVDAVASAKVFAHPIAERIHSRHFPGSATHYRKQMRTSVPAPAHPGAKLRPGVRGPQPLASQVGGVLPGVVQQVSSSTSLKALAPGQPDVATSGLATMGASASASKKGKRGTNKATRVCDANVELALVEEQNRVAENKKAPTYLQYVINESKEELSGNKRVMEEMDRLKDEYIYAETAEDQTFQDDMLLPALGMGGFSTSNQAVYGFSEENPALYNEMAREGRGAYSKENPSYKSHQIKAVMKNIPDGTNTLQTMKQTFDYATHGPPVPNREANGESLFFQNIARDKLYFGKLLGKDSLAAAEKYLKENMHTGSNEEATRQRRDFLAVMRSLYTTSNNRDKKSEYTERFEGKQRDVDAALMEKELNEEIFEGSVNEQEKVKGLIEKSKQKRVEDARKKREAMEAAQKELEKERAEVMRMRQKKELLDLA